MASPATAGGSGRARPSRLFSATASSTADWPVARMTSTFAPAGSTSVHPGSSSTPSTRPGLAHPVSRRCRKRRTSASYTETSSCSSGDACRPKSPSSTGPRREALRGRHRRPSDWSQRSSVALDRELWGETATLTRPRRSPCARRQRGCRAAVARGRRTPVPAPGPPRSGSSRVPPSSALESRRSAVKQIGQPTVSACRASFAPPASGSIATTGTPFFNARTSPWRRVVTSASVRATRLSTSAGVRRPTSLVSRRVSIVTTAACRTSRSESIAGSVRSVSPPGYGSTLQTPTTGTGGVSLRKTRSGREVRELSRSQSR